MIQYRTFRNPDPPGLLDVWNACFPNRGAIPLRATMLLEYFTLAKPYFDPKGLIVAQNDQQIVGFAHAGFGAKPDGSGVDPSRGILCTIGVVPPQRRQGIGTELLRRAEEYLRQQGAQELLAGPLAPDNPFTFGLYGGSSSPGFLTSDALARPFLESRGYRPVKTGLVFRRALDRVQLPPDPRFPAFRQRFEIHAGPLRGMTWWRDCTLGPIDLVEYNLFEKATEQVLARATLWEMEFFSQAWNEHAVGLVDLEVVADHRREGMGRFLLAQILRHLQDQFFSMVEVQTLETNTAGINLVKGMGFQQSDTGYQYARSPSEGASGG